VIIVMCSWCGDETKPGIWENHVCKVDAREEEK
jgi:hypothetical protein